MSGFRARLRSAVVTLALALGVVAVLVNRPEEPENRPPVRLSPEASAAIDLIQRTAARKAHEAAGGQGPVSTGTATGLADGLKLPVWAVTW